MEKEGLIDASTTLRTPSKDDVSRPTTSNASVTDTMTVDRVTPPLPCNDKPSSISSEAKTCSKPEPYNFTGETRCSICGVRSCSMWRRLENSLSLCCNSCHLKRVKAIVNSQQKYRDKPKESTAVTRSTRKGRISKSKNGGVKNNDKPKLPTAKSRRAKLKRKPSRGAEGVATIVTSNRICHKDIIYHYGDIVAITDFDGSIYYAQLCGFLQNDYGEKYGVITWLLPIVPSPKKFDPSLFVPGPTEDIPRPMECFEFVSRAPNDFFKWRASSISRTKSTADLHSLVKTANILLNEESKEES